jgi:hypothetical protein
MTSRIQARQITAVAGADNVHQLGAGLALWPEDHSKILANA